MSAAVSAPIGTDVPQECVPPLRGLIIFYRYPGFRAAHSILGYDRSSLAGLGAM